MEASCLPPHDPVRKAGMVSSSVHVVIVYGSATMRLRASGCMGRIFDCPRDTHEGNDEENESDTLDSHHDIYLRQLGHVGEWYSVPQIGQTLYSSSPKRKSTMSPIPMWIMRDPTPQRTWTGP